MGYAILVAILIVTLVGIVYAIGYCNGRADECRERESKEY